MWGTTSLKILRSVFGVFFGVCALSVCALIITQNMIFGWICFYSAMPPTVIALYMCRFTDDDDDHA